ncbi:hypothetical protein GOP47_0001446 [Adiantum capillus-veneris]|uniref:DNA mismatch repair proteins mutS family domain-containing protein n=1 Tax=Adiantum capillus-veneris TaxID=13818 RepID=A0A9D4V8Q1_ADICA|nr:hypothetical protein GOP47_0001446 [Adiantum capillus-veneris]
MRQRTPAPLFSRFLDLYEESVGATRVLAGLPPLVIVTRRLYQLSSEARRPLDDLPQRGHAAYFMKEMGCRAGPACTESRVLMAMRVARGAGACCLDARTTTSSLMLHKLPLLRAHPTPLTCRRSLASGLYQAFRHCFSLCYHPAYLTQWQPCLRVEVARVNGSRNSKSSVQELQSSSKECIEWWAKKVEQMKKPVVKELIKRLSYSNLLGLDENLKNGSCRDGSLNGELLGVKTKYPCEVLLCRVGEFYEAVGFDACVLVEYASLNPMSGLRSDTVPRAGCPVMNLRQTLDALTSSGFSVCVYEEVKGPSQGRVRKDRFVSGHAHPGSPYVYGLAEANVDLDVQEEVFVVGISRSSRGYCLTFVSEMMRTFSVEDALTEEAAVARLRTKTCFQLFLHRSLQKHSSGLYNWREYGEGGMLWAECQGKSCEWFDHDSVSQIIAKVKILYSLDPAEEFREVVFQSKGRPKPLSVGTASQIGIIPTVGVPSLLRVLLPTTDSTGLCCAYMRDLLLNPPTAKIASAIQVSCKLMLQVTSAIPDFTCVSAAKLVKLISSKEANYLEFSRVRRLAEDVILMHKDEQMHPILQNLLVPASSSTGLEMDCQVLVNNCAHLVTQLNNVLAAEGDLEQLFSSVPHIPDDFFQTLEYTWRGRVKRELADDCYEEVQNAAQQLSTAVENDFIPIVMRVRASDAHMMGSPKADIMFSRDNDAVWLKLRNIPASLLKEFSGLLPAQDAKCKRVKDDLYSTVSVESALERYRTAVLSASSRVYEIFRNLAEELKGRLNTIVFTSVLAVIAKTLFAHVSEGTRRDWTFPELVNDDDEELLTHDAKDGTYDSNPAMVVPRRKDKLVMEDLIPYWADKANSVVVSNSVRMSSLHLLTGPNGGGKSSILRSIGAATVLGMCGLMVPCSSAWIPRFDAVMLRMMPQDSPADGKSSFQMEMSELRTILQGITSRSMVLVDEICRGTEVQKGTAITASVIEFLDSAGCMGILSTHLHGLLDMKLDVKNLVYKAMGTTIIDGALKPTWKMDDGCCRESLAFETARSEGVEESVLDRARELYAMYFDSQQSALTNGAPVSLDSSLSCISLSDKKGVLENVDCKQSANECTADAAGISQGPERNAIAALDGLARLEQDANSCMSQSSNGKTTNGATKVFEESCRRKISELYKRCFMGDIIGNQDIAFTKVGYCEQPPPGAVGRSCVYLMLRPDGRFYIGQTDNISGRIKAHRSKPGLQRAVFMYVQIANKSLASELETSLLNELPSHGVVLVNKADQNHRHFGTRTFVPCELPF